MYENSRFLKNRFTFCGINTNFGQQWAPPAYYHLTPIVSKGKHCIFKVLIQECVSQVFQSGDIDKIETETNGYWSIVVSDGRCESGVIDGRHF